ncbi:MAG: tryptophan 2,3-dioxygenase family protein [Bacteroidota bacterium]|nr:tryptophan 2,3-dioxygenase family protein [Bacteroidota bacterium]MDP4231406.1 tryptophan 2,3-dioxygenase family protein [Bacteroidota bacterium]MDP4236804.1 tryptophan 2,3-dioxygenase family protein [Bacteroidota bacterium]
MPENKNLTQAIEKLTARYGERAVDYIEGAAIRRELTYDDYIKVDTLLSLQQPLTEFHDEWTFMIYHQQTELWFRLLLHEMRFGISQLIATPPGMAKAMESVRRANRIFGHLTESFDVLIEGLSSDQFLEFRKAFGASSGFQSAQFRAIEILAGLDRKAIKGQDNTFYWERAARDKETGEPTLTLLNFKEKHLSWLNQIYEKREPHSLRFAFEKVVADRLHIKPTNPQEFYQKFWQTNDDELLRFANELLKLDELIIGWKIAHLRSAAKHLAKVPRGTGETNWAEYLAKSISDEKCFPELALAKKEAEHEEEVEVQTLADA